MAASAQNPKCQVAIKTVDLLPEIDLAIDLRSVHEKDLEKDQEIGQGRDLETGRETGNAVEAVNVIIVDIDIGPSLSRKTKRRHSAVASVDENDVPVESKRKLELMLRTNRMTRERMMLTSHGVPHHLTTRDLVIEVVAERKTNTVTATVKGIEIETTSRRLTNIALTAQEETTDQEAEIGIEIGTGKGIETRTATVNVAAIAIMSIAAITLGVGHQKSPRRRNLTANRCLLLLLKMLLPHGSNQSSPTQPLDLRFEEPPPAGNRSLPKCQTFPQVHVAIENERVI